MESAYGRTESLGGIVRSASETRRRCVCCTNGYTYTRRDGTVLVGWRSEVRYGPRAVLEGDMHRTLALIALIPLLGCAPSDANRAPSMRAANLDPYCAEVARWRAVDAASNGYDENIQRRIYREAFDACRTSPTVFTEIAPPAEKGKVAGR